MHSFGSWRYNYEIYLYLNYKIMRSIFSLNAFNAFE